MFAKEEYDHLSRIYSPIFSYLRGREEQRRYLREDSSDLCPVA